MKFRKFFWVIIYPNLIFENFHTTITAEKFFGMRHTDYNKNNK